MPRLDPSRSVLVVIDVQEKLAPAMQESAMTDLVRASSILLEAARLLSVRVLATEQYPQGLGPTIAPLREKLSAMSITPLAKTTFSAADDPAFSKELFASSPRQIVLVGMEAHICVLQTARDLTTLGLEVHVVRDGVTSRREDHKQTGLALAEREGAYVTTAETVAFDWLRRAQGDAFKAVSRLVR
jgi:nicotinamidase-related amidase